MRLIFSILLCMAATALRAQTDTLAVRTADGVVLVPGDLVAGIDGVRRCTVRLKHGGGTIEGVRIATPHVDADFPRFRSFKFNDKYNDILFADAEGVLADDAVTVDVTACIGKTLCPSFALTSEECAVYLDGVRQLSHANRHRFDRPLTYTIARPGYTVMRLEGGKCVARPWGREVTVTVTFAVDRADDVPRIDITLDGGRQLSAIDKTTYLPAKIKIDGGGVFPDMAEQAVKIRGRGNSSWEQYDKKPYRLKFDTKQKPFGLKGGKSWCLLAQARTGTLLTNPIALRVASMTGTKGANHVVPVELYVNGQYRGSYIFTENPGFANNSIDLPDESNAYMLELDAYFDDQWIMYDDTYQLTVNIKEPNLDKYDYGDWDEYRRSIVDPFNRFTAAIRKGECGTYEAMMDIDSWSRYMLVNDLVMNTELKEPRSVKIYRQDRTDDADKYVWGPVWDFDWAFGLPDNIYADHAEEDFYRAVGFNYGISASGFNPGTFFYDMLTGSDNLKAARYRVWAEFMDGWFDELLDYIDDYQRYAARSFSHDNTLWKKGSTDKAAAAKAWLRKRAAWVYAGLPRYELPTVTYERGDVNEDGRVSAADVYLVANKIVGRPVGEFFNADNADMNGDGRITVGDLQMIVKAAAGE